MDPGVSWSSWSGSGYGSPGLVSVSVYKCLELLKDELAWLRMAAKTAKVSLE